MYMSPCDVPSYVDAINHQKEMQKSCHQAIDAISTMCSPYFGIEFGRLLAYGLKDGVEEAELICRAIGIGEREMAALIDDKEWFDQVVYDL